MRPRLYVIPASPPCAAIEAALRLKGVAYDVREHLADLPRCPEHAGRDVPGIAREPPAGERDHALVRREDARHKI